MAGIRIKPALIKACSLFRGNRGDSFSVVAVIVLQLFLVITFNTAPVYAEDISPQERLEIDHLLHYIENSACLFLRNGSWHGSKDAANHIMGKYRYLVDRGQIASTEDFIEKSASRSSMSGRLYLIKCGAEEMSSGEWLRLELQRFRDQAGKDAQ